MEDQEQRVAEEARDASPKTLAIEASLVRHVFPEC